MAFPWFKRRRRQLGGFDAEFYLDTYPDVAASSLSPEEHYLRQGWREGRDPSSVFSTTGYLKANPDVAAAGVNPLQHFWSHGLAEGRQGWSRSPSASTPQLPKDSEEENIFGQFLARIEAAPPSVVCEVGTLQSIPGISTHSFRSFPSVARANYVMVDVQPGPDVDVVADIHCLPEDWTNRFDAFIASAVFEHLARPWLAAKEVARVLAPGGLCFISTHQTFPLHAYPSDFFRFSTDALSLLFTDAGLEVLHLGYQDRCLIIPPESVVLPGQLRAWNKTFPSYARVSLVGRKPVNGAP